MPMVVIRRFRDPWEAQVAQSRLRDAGLTTCLLDENVVSLNWLYSQAVGGVGLCVEASQQDVAAALLEPAGPEPERPRGLASRAAILGLLVGGPPALLLAAVALAAQRRSRRDGAAGKGPSSP